MTTSYLPWLRRGWSGSAGVQPDDTGSGPVEHRASASVWVEVGGQKVRQTVGMRTADEVVAIDPAQVLRRYPSPGADQVEREYFAHLEHRAPDLPWLFTPTAPGSWTTTGGVDAGGIRPWIVLVVVEDLPEITYTAGGGGDGAGMLAVPAPQVSTELPDLAESWAWAHVQVAGDPAQVDALLEVPGAVVSRLVCPRLLDPLTSYRAAVVGAFSRKGDQLEPAWDVGAPERVDLTVYDTWTFSTGPAGDFEALCRRLEPAADGADLGIHPMDVTDPGLIDPWPDPVTARTVDFEGALIDVGVEGGSLSAADQRRLARELVPVLEDGAARPVLDPAAPDPVLAPPLYGSIQGRFARVPVAGWPFELNLSPGRRAAAGLGAEVVRQNQERLMAAAWDQVGQLSAVNRELSTARLGAEIGRTWKARCDRLADADRLQVGWSQLTFVRRADGEPARASLQASVVPRALLGPAGQRLLRPAGVAARAGAARSTFATVRAFATGTFLRASDPEAPEPVRSAADFGQVSIPHGALVAGRAPRLNPGIALANRLATLDADRVAEGWAAYTRRFGRPPPQLGPIPAGPGRTEPAAERSAEDTAEQRRTDGADVSGLASDWSASISPLADVRRRMQARVPALTSILDPAGDDTVPTRVRVGPRFSQPLYPMLVDLGPELLVPGAADLGTNRVRLVEANPAFVAAFLAGANHEMARELRWREFPADLGTTFFSRFWDWLDRSVTDIDPIDGWATDAALATLGGAGDGATVVLIRGDVVHRYPGARYLLIDPDETAHDPDFRGVLAPDSIFLGWNQPPDEVLAGGWFLAIEEGPVEPRFGLDAEAASAVVEDWDDLAWDHLPEGTRFLPAGSVPDAVTDVPTTEATWGRNSAHMARIAFQRPFRILFPVEQLIGTGASLR